ncbi:MAG: DNA-binding response regulator [Flavobacteriia bacterium]|nr:MAG: DNA-binding response regulator [Flavobacteriia bacterium]
MYNIIIADDHKMFLDGLLSIFAEVPEYNILLTAHSGKNIIKYIDINPDKSIDLVITDISMPDVDGITLNNHIKKTRPEIKTLVVSMHTDTKMIDTLVKNNVDGFISKNSEKEELLKAVKTILNGEKYFSQSVRDVYMQSVFVKQKSEIQSLTKREKDVLKLIAEEYTTDEIAEKLFLSKHTINSYRKTLLLKLNVKNLAGLTKYAIKLGLVK